MLLVGINQCTHLEPKALTNLIFNLTRLVLPAEWWIIEVLHGINSKYSMYSTWNGAKQTTSFYPS